MEMLIAYARHLAVASLIRVARGTSWWASSTDIVKPTALGVHGFYPNVLVNFFCLLMSRMNLTQNVHVFSLSLAIQCEVPQNPLNGRAVYSTVSYNSLISYECNYGYMLIGDSVRRCERNKMWTGTEPHCKGEKRKGFASANIPPRGILIRSFQRSTVVRPVSCPTGG